MKTFSFFLSFFLIININLYSQSLCDTYGGATVVYDYIHNSGTETFNIDPSLFVGEVNNPKHILLNANLDLDSDFLIENCIIEIGHPSGEIICDFSTNNELTLKNVKIYMQWIIC